MQSLLLRSICRVTTISNMRRLGQEQISCRKFVPIQNFLANPVRMASVENSRWERESWPEIKRLTSEVPEAGIHFRVCPL
jgi:hypothetical protein